MLNSGLLKSPSAWAVTTFSFVLLILIMHVFFSKDIEDLY